MFQAVGVFLAAASELCQEQHRRDEAKAAFDVALHVPDADNARADQAHRNVGVIDAGACHDCGYWWSSGSKPLSDTRRGRADFGRNLPSRFSAGSLLHPLFPRNHYVQCLIQPRKGDRCSTVDVHMRAQA
ncbi:protein of unknown function [Agreia sp. COWG]|nr:protein of unknown function [Agreia sp. COWG]